MKVTKGDYIKNLQDETNIQTVANPVYTEWVSQLQKDIFRAGISFDISSNDISELFEEIACLILELILYDFKSYLNLLYVIDVSEKAIKQFPSENSKEIAWGTTFLILRREWEKVKYRNKF